MIKVYNNCIKFVTLTMKVIVVIEISEIILRYINNKKS